MKDEIKHIKVLLENHVALSDDEDKILLDHITNLQDRIDKAVEYIENDMPYLEEPDDDYENNHKMVEYDRSELLNILQGKSDE